MRAGMPPVQRGAPVRIASLADLKPPAPLPLGGTNGHPHVHVPPLGVAHPPPASGVSVAAEDEPAEPRRWSAMWPLIVAVIAICAILASVALLIFGGDEDKKSSKAKRFEGPAPELMPTDPGAQQVPFGNGALPGPTPTIPDPAPAPSAPPGPPGPSAPHAAPNPTGAAPRDVAEFVRQAVQVGCDRMQTCGVDDMSIRQSCSMAPSLIPQMADQMKAMCSDFDGRAGRACIDSIGRLPCPSSGADSSTLALTLLGLSDCQNVCPSAFGSLGGAFGGSGGALGTDPDDDDDPAEADDPTF